LALENSLWAEEPGENSTWQAGQWAWNSLLPPRKGRRFGKSRASDFVRRMPGITLLTKALNRHLELSFCRQCIYQQQSQIRDTCRLNKLPFQLCETVSVKVLGGVLTGKLNLISGYTLNPLDINC